MNSLEARLIELNDALVKMSDRKEIPSDALINQARQTLAGGYPQINTGAGNDTVIINQQGDQDGCQQNGATGPQGDQGATGATGQDGYNGEQGSTGAGGEVGATGEQGTMGSSGATGPAGPPGECDCECKRIVVSQDYHAQMDDYYIGVNSSRPVTITLPANCRSGCKIIIKAEMGPPLGYRKITIITEDGSMIDGEYSYIIEVPYQSVSMICRAGDWWII